MKVNVYCLFDNFNEDYWYMFSAENVDDAKLLVQDNLDRGDKLFLVGSYDTKTGDLINFDTNVEV